MEIHDRTGIKGKVNYKCYGPDGKLKWEHESHNTITELHDALVADRLSGGTDDLMTHCHLGTSTGATSASADLIAPCAENRTAVDSTTQGEGAVDNDVVIVTTFPAETCTGTITEAGLFSSLSYSEVHDMKCYDDSINKVKADADSLVLTWTISYGAS